MALWRACIACPPRALDSLGPAAGRVPLPSGSFRLHVFVLFYKPITSVGLRDACARPTLRQWDWHAMHVPDTCHLGELFSILKISILRSALPIRGPEVV